MNKPPAEKKSCDATCRTGQRAARSFCAVRQFVLTAALIVIADLGIKYYVFADIAGQPIRPADLAVFDEHAYEPAPLVPSVLSLKLTINHGAVFGMGQGGRWVFILVSLIAVGVIAAVFLRSEARARWLNLALALVLGGAMGNLYDRVVFGAVRDMFWLFPEVKLPFHLHWPGGNDEVYPWIFNLADASLLVGIILLFIVVYFGGRRESKVKEEAPAEPSPPENLTRRIN